MKIRITSDLHTDINKTIEFGFVKHINDCDLTLIAGDIAGGYKQEELFLDNLVKQGLEKPVICVGGNHLGYNNEQGTKEYQLRQLIDKFNETPSNIHYLENQCWHLSDDYVVYGGTMYTDFGLYNDKPRKYYGEVAEQWMNDFRYVETYNP